MGIESEVLLCTSEHVNTVEAIQAIADHLQAVRCSMVSISNAEDQSWARWRASVGRPIPHVRLDAVSAPNAMIFATNMSVPDLIAQLSSHGLVAGFFEYDTWQSLDDAVVQSVPAHIRGTYVPSSIGFTAGAHDVFDPHLHRFGRYIVRSQFDLKFFCQGSPDGGDSFIGPFLDIPFVQALRRRVEAVTGPLTPVLAVNT